MNEVNYCVRSVTWPVAYQTRAYIVLARFHSTTNRPPPMACRVPSAGTQFTATDRWLRCPMKSPVGSHVDLTGADHAAEIYRPLGYERVYLTLCKVANTPFHIQGDDTSQKGLLGRDKKAAVQRQTAAAAHFISKQLLLFAFASQNGGLRYW